MLNIQELLIDIRRYVLLRKYDELQIAIKKLFEHYNIDYSHITHYNYDNMVVLVPEIITYKEKFIKFGIPIMWNTTISIPKNIPYKLRPSQYMEKQINGDKIKITNLLNYIERYETYEIEAAFTVIYTDIEKMKNDILELKLYKIDN